MSEPRSFLDAVRPPDDHVGWAAVFVSMSADVDVVEEVMTEVFAAGARSRDAMATITAWLLLDPHASPTRTTAIGPGVVPGLLELQPRAVAAGSLLHAKMVLAGYAPSFHAPAPTHLRLIVYTGNLTRASIRYQLELVCRWDGEVGRIRGVDAADFAAAGEFIQTLIARRYYRPESSPGSLSRRADSLLAALPDAPRERPRLIHSLDQPLMPQIRTRFRHHVNGNANFLLAGSGFFEDGGASSAKPKVVKDLEELVPMTARPSRVLLVNPRQCGAVAGWVNGGGDFSAWRIRAATDPHGARALHAKFILVGHRREATVSGGCLYVGSGNLSVRGLRSAGAQDGNVECGAVLPVERWASEKGMHCLFFDEAVDEIPELDDRDGEPEVGTTSLIDAPPVLSGAVVNDGAEWKLLLYWRDDLPSGRTYSAYLDDSWHPVGVTVAPICWRQAPRLAKLTVRDDVTSARWDVPLVDELGRACWRPPVFTSIVDALDALLAFPGLPDEVDEEGGNAGRGEGEAGSTHLSGALAIGRHTLYEAAEFVEAVSDRQAKLEPGQIQAWLEHLDRMLTGAPPAADVARWRAVGVDVLGELCAPSLAPKDMSAQQRTNYVQVLGRHRSAWGGA